MLNSISRHLLGPWLILKQHRRLTFALLRQDIQSTYARSVLGLFWIILLPLFYALVLIGVRFVAFDNQQTHWVPDQQSPDSTAWSAFAMLTGLLVFWLASEILSRSPAAVRKNAVLVTDTAFPVGTLPWVTVGLSIFNFTVRFALMALAYCLFLGIPHWQIILTPLTLLPLLSVMVGVAYLFSAVGVFISDLEFVVQILMTALFLLSGILFPLTVVPLPYRDWLLLNPIAFFVEHTRKIALDGQNPDWLLLLAIFAAGMAICALGHFVFTKLQGRFSDVL